ncbi:hypothetical protein DM01DRAFT_1317372 [Hesseltinella vesiculosa]|uniref:DUF4112 domain-containing protein n=1 Tax=Hesseltinella vesiculosa TaxID=101127 RepID=A0A1X2GTB2_9FUNG|nr:hypothetical protein DM01DRAFT_1317372 [Hesseltinella vesiculosa]
MSEFIATYIEGQARKHLQGAAADALNPQLTYRNDPEVLALQEEAAKSSKHFWWKRQQKPDVILSKRDRQVLRAVKRRAVFLDKGFNCCCFTFGFDFLIGLIPGIGDFIGMLLGLELIKVACKADLPKHILVQMVTNVLVDFVVGLTPVIGDIMDAVLKCNWRNALILEEYLMIRRRDELRMERGMHPEHHKKGTGDNSKASTSALKSSNKVSPSPPAHSPPAHSPPKPSTPDPTTYQSIQRTNPKPSHDH